MAGLNVSSEKIIISSPATFEIVLDSACDGVLKIIAKKKRLNNSDV
jgi:hypothetical protein